MNCGSRISSKNLLSFSSERVTRSYILRSRSIQTSSFSSGRSKSGSISASLAQQAKPNSANSEDIPSSF